RSQSRGVNRALALALVGSVAGVIAFAVLWQLQTSRATRLQNEVTQQHTSLLSTRAALRSTREQLSAATRLSAKRRAVLLQAGDVASKVDPLLSAVDNIEGKAGELSAQGSTVAFDAESFISTVTDLVNYLVRTSTDYVDYAWVNQEIDAANTQLG